MRAADRRPAGEEGEHSGSRSAIVIASSKEAQNRIAGVMDGQGLRPAARIDDAAAIARLEIDASTIVVFACDIDDPRGMADLRRLGREARAAAIVVISPPATGAGVRRALDAGADALVFDSELELTLATAVRAVASGQSVVPRKLRASVERPSLSHRELQVLAMVRQGLTNAEIAERLFLAESTIKSHLGSAFAKLGVHSRREAATVLTDLERAAGATLKTPLCDSPEQATA